MTKFPELEPPAPGARDKIIDLIKAAVGELPGGGILVEICGSFLRTPFERRTAEWQQTVGEVLWRLESEKGVDLEQLQKDDQFVDCLLQATQVALRTSQEEKREALRNAVMNSAFEHSPDESDRQMFIQLIDRFTPWHLRLLDFLDNPPAWFDRHGRKQPTYGITSCLVTVIEEAYPELKPRQAFYEQVCSELDSSGLCSVSKSLKTAMTADGWKASRTSERGKLFLQFTKRPIESSSG